MPSHTTESGTLIASAPGAGAFSCVVSCEHGGHAIPAAYAALFSGQDELLRSHRGFDPGALKLARALAQALAAPLVASTTSRLVIELNRSPGHRALYSTLTRAAPDKLRAQIYTRHYLPYRQRLEETLAEAARRGVPILHFSCHSFTPVLAGEVRTADIGLLYDPRRSGESELCRRWVAELKARSPQWRVRRNYPYTGRSDGVCTALRKQYGARDYLGIEIELNQRHFAAGRRCWQRLCGDLIAALLSTLGLHAE